MKNNLVWPFLKKYYLCVKAPLVFVTLAGPIIAFCNQLVPWYVSKIVNLINSGVPDEAKWQELLEVCTFMLVLVVATTVLSLLAFYVMQNKVIAPLGISVRQDLFAQVLEKHKDFWSKNTAGNVFSKIDSCRRTTAAWSSIGNILLFANTSVCGFLASLYFVAKIYWPMALVYLIASVLLFMAFHKLAENTAQASKQQENLKNKVFGLTTNMISNYFILKIFGSLGRELKTLDKNYIMVGKAMQKNAWLRNKNNLFVCAALLLFETSMVVYAVILWSKEMIDVGNVVYILTAVMTSGNILRNLAMNWIYYRSEIFKMRNNLNLLNAEIEIKDTPNAKKLKLSKGAVEFRNLCFAYNRRKPAVVDFNLSIKPGEKVGIIGMSGSGKTTLLHLLQRLINTPENSIFIDGQDITKVTQDSLHRALAFIPQDTSLFHRSLSENLSYGSFEAGQSQIKEAAKQSYIEEFGPFLPQGYKTLVGDKGVKLSGGQRQRVGIARAILKDCKILLLDEATSALDSKSEKYIQQSLQKLIKNKTVIAVAHRLSTLKNMDRIVVMDEGRILEQGSPAELLDKQGKFAKIWNLQA